MHQLSDYSYDLPEELIAQVPADRRDASRLLRVDSDAFADLAFSNVVELIPSDAVVVVNDTKVVPARLSARKPTGGAVELVLIERAAQPDAWLCMARASKPIRANTSLQILRGDDVHCMAEVLAERDEHGYLAVRFEIPALEVCEQVGHLPLPPYIERVAGPTTADHSRYQTVYADEPGAVAAPTAGLHFTSELLERIRQRGAVIAPLTLHVGPGTFAPVRTEDIRQHRLHQERYVIPERTAELVGSGREVVAIGTTSVRALEASARGSGRVVAGAGRTDLFIRPGFEFRVVDYLVSNFHLPESTLLMLVAAFVGFERTLAAYRHAVSNRYRFYSYGDAMWLARKDLA